MYTDFSRFIERDLPTPLDFEPDLWPAIPRGETSESQAITEQWIVARKEWNEAE